MRTPKQSPRALESEILWSSDIQRDNRISERCFRNWVVAGRFPKPDGNIAGRNFWRRATYAQWQSELLAGKFSQNRLGRLARRGAPAVEAGKANRPRASVQAA